MAYHFRNLVFEGGGVKGIAYVGAVKVLEEKGIMPDIERVGGTSAGAINAVMVGLGYTSAQTMEIMNKLDFKKFMDDDTGVFRDIDRLLNEFGWHKGAFFRKWIGKVIKKKTGSPDSTFADVQKMKKQKGFLDMYFIGANISTHFAEVFSFASALPMRCGFPCRSRCFLRLTAARAAMCMSTAGSWIIIRLSFLTAKSIC